MECSTRVLDLRKLSVTHLLGQEKGVRYPFLNHRLDALTERVAWPFRRSPPSLEAKSSCADPDCTMLGIGNYLQAGWSLGI